VLNIPVWRRRGGGRIAIKATLTQDFGARLDGKHELTLNVSTEKPLRQFTATIEELMDFSHNGRGHFYGIPHRTKV
jgi:hypothetical protein